MSTFEIGSKSSMNRLLLSLCLLGAALSTANTLFFSASSCATNESRTAFFKDASLPVTSAPPTKPRPAQKAAAAPAAPALQDLTGSLGDSPAKGETPTSGQVAKAGAKPSDAPEFPQWAEVSLAAKAHSGPSVSTPTLRYYRVGTQLRVIDRQSGWIKIVDPTSAQQGWIYEKYLTLKDSPTQTAPAKRPFSTAERLPKPPGWRWRRAYPPFGFAIRVYPRW